MIKVHIVPHPENFNVLWSCPRAEALIRQGLQKLDEVQLVEENQADFLFYCYVPQANGEKYNTADLKKIDPERLVILDYTDEPNKYFIEPKDCFVYFKRSCSEPVNSKLGSTQICTEMTDVVFYTKRLQKNNLFKITYGILDEFPICDNTWDERPIDVGCYLRPSCPNRAYILNYVKILKEMYHWNFHIGEVSSGSRSVGEKVYIDPTYFEYLSNTKIVITCGPTWWIGDSRPYEAWAAGCYVINFQQEDLLDLSWVKKSLKQLLNPYEDSGEHSRQFQVHNARTYFSSTNIMCEAVDLLKRLKNG